MQEALLSPASADRLRSALELKLFAFGDQRLSSQRYLNLAGGGDDALFRCSSPFSPSCGFSSPSPQATSVSLSPSSSASLVDDGDDAAAADATGHRLQLARLALKYQEVADRYELCLAHLAEAVDEEAALRRENAELRVANSDLTNRLALLSGIGKQAAAVAIADEIRRLRLGEQKVVATDKERAPEKLAVLPKSISVRSNEYLKMNHPAQAPATTAGHNRRSRASNATNPSSQRVYAGSDGGRKGEEPKEQSASGGGMELEVCNQGMFKTELCNKWEETGACPYGDQCQFAHGVAELRPVIRHPRYKTQVCRMVLAGELCPYGHRCHFRHSLTPTERLLVRP
ncbi:zinc finger CCCH domain-containing protein 9-like isoform X2 [Phragmites australis]|uniref:zinc finger CCCH domain-containing protein 9-like isoform X2 n=1 Tax=Phragmites australis TaxID=29695 RepID=UPI002D7A3C52|nr:zinc finger CCCH domain-containing protein 9-like isoform X2 [Phragmites australis]